ncbi:unnamed protein product [Bursaphelenchus xylophilus]|uniref:(pine wood nematode) hypothetical protein n=1 Tax=Bursaphelenchus xylophilus TaxID=6326 RepID=A0A1I7S284_BURXY|nr:unnamed protein product [Bursaphelenchus xylophilus]CAG9114811.1 unnamed protein product [Bursaphelenchus xylophilus]
MNQSQIDLYLLCTLIYTIVISLVTLAINFVPHLSRDFSRHEENGNFILFFQIVVSIAAVLDFFTNAIRYYRRHSLNFTKPKWSTLVAHIVPTVASIALCVTFVCIYFDGDPFMIKFFVWSLLLFLLNMSQISVLVLRYLLH